MRYDHETVLKVFTVSQDGGCVFAPDLVFLFFYYTLDSYQTFISYRYQWYHSLDF